MNQLETLDYAVLELEGVVVKLDDAQMDTVTNCEPWTVRRLASHALNNQLLWAGLVTGQELVSVEDTMGAAPIAATSRRWPTMSPTGRWVSGAATVCWRRCTR